jgi:hypothetical protein
MRLYRAFEILCVAVIFLSSVLGLGTQARQQDTTWQWWQIKGLTRCSFPLSQRQE